MPYAFSFCLPFSLIQSVVQAGDKTSWEQSLRARAQYGQNDYTRAP